MNTLKANVTVPIDLSNPGQFFACCGLLELADRLWPGTEGWFTGSTFLLDVPQSSSIDELLGAVAASTVENTMTSEQNARLDALSAMKKKEREATPGLEEEKKRLESLRRELPILIDGPISFRIDWFRDEFTGGSRFKTWAGQQSVLEITRAMHRGMSNALRDFESSLWSAARGGGLPFNFDSDLGAQGSPLDVGFSFDPLAASETTRLEGTCKPALEFLCFIGLQRFRPREIPRQNRFVYALWHRPLRKSVASAVTSGAVRSCPTSEREFQLLYRTKYLKSFLPSIPFQGEPDE